jgi:hypothetical protein
VRDIQLGIDTELVITTPHGVLYPHVAKVAQERTVLDRKWDWHGDGYAWELCVAPSDKPEGIIQNVAGGLLELWDAWNIRRACGPSVYVVPQRIIRSAPKDVKRLGCMPSLNAYGAPARPTGLPDTMRTTGCHLHVSSPEIDKENYLNIIQHADLLVGQTWAYLSPESAFDERTRRKFYGRAGEHRVRFYDDAMQLFGVEYRTLPGSVLHHPDYLHLMLALMQEAAKRAKYGPPDADFNDAVRVINRADRRGDYLKYLDLPFGTMAFISMVKKYNTRMVDIDAWKKYA